jgi:hypothetical protein
MEAAVDIDNGMCGSLLRFTGECIDWNSDRNFCDMNNAVATVRDTGLQDMLPHGRINLCVPNQPVTLIDITPPAVNPDCQADKTHHYQLSALAIANKAVILAGGLWSGRTFVETTNSYDPAKAQVFVHVDGTPRAVSLDSAHSHGPIQAVVTATWAPGDTGHEVYIPDVDPAGGSATLTVAGGAVGAGSIPLVAGKMTTLSVIAH